MTKSTIRGVLTALFVVPLLAFLVLGHGHPTVRVAASQASDNKSDDGGDGGDGHKCDNGRNMSEESHESDGDEKAENDGHESDDDCNEATSSTMKATTTTARVTTTTAGATTTTAGATTTTAVGGEDVCENNGLLGPETIADQLVDAGIPLHEPEADGPISSAIVSSLGALAPISSEAACVVNLLTL